MIRSVTDEDRVMPSRATFYSPAGNRSSQSKTPPPMDGQSAAGSSGKHRDSLVVRHMVVHGTLSDWAEGVAGGRSIHQRVTELSRNPRKTHQGGLPASNTQATTRLLPTPHGLDSHVSVRHGHGRVSGRRPRSFGVAADSGPRRCCCCVFVVRERRRFCAAH